MNKAFKKILERLEEMRRKSYIPDIKGYCQTTISRAEAIVQEVAEEYNDSWIPCSERLPDVSVDVLLTLRSLDIYTGFRANTNGYFYVEGINDYVPFKNVIAWQPLPEP